MTKQFDGDTLNNTLIGSWGDDLIDGQGGADVMAGGGGNDIYIVDNVGDVVRETPDFHIFDDTLVQLVSSTVEQVRGDGASTAPAINADGSAIVFFSTSNNLYANFSPTNNELVIKLPDTQDVAPLHTTSDGALASPGPEAEIQITPDSHYVVFSSAAVNLSGADTTANDDIYVKDLTTDTVTFESQAGAGGGSALARLDPVISDDGRYVAFTALENLLGADANGASDTDVFLRDRQTGSLALVSGAEDGSVQGSSDNGADSDSANASLAVTADGTVLVAFESAAGHLPGATDGNGQKDIFIKILGTPSLIDLTETLSQGVKGVAANGPSFDAQFTADGHYLIFSTQATTLLASDSNGSVDLFRYDAVADQLELVNTSRAGAQSNFGALHGDISADGRFVVFESRSTNLVTIANDSNARDKIFVKDMDTGDIEVVSRTSTGAFVPDFSAAHAQISDDGRFIVFSTQAALTANDAGTNQDVYRVPNPLYSPADEIHASVDYTLPAGVEVLLLTGNAALRGTGNGLDNLMTGNDAANVLSGGAGNDTLHGMGAADVLSGDAGNDLLDGGDGLDTASYALAAAAVTVNLNLLGAQNTGGAGSDSLSSIENLLGGKFNDRLSGDAGANRIDGGAGNDVLSGGGSQDVLLGGLGRDTLSGGAAADTFVFKRSSESGITAALADIVKDFKHAEHDRIDLSAIDARSGTTAKNDAFKFIGTHAFDSHNASGQLHFDAAHHMLYASTDADTAPEFALSLPGVNSLAAGDFIL